MYVLYSTKWDKTRIIGQERLLADAWLETVSDDAHPASWPPLFSVVQLFRNLISIIEGISSQTLAVYHLKDACDELLARLDSGTWLDECFQDDIPFMREKLRWARDQTKDKKEDIQARDEMLSYLRAFVAKLESVRPWQQQVKSLSVKVADFACDPADIVRAVGELTNDLMHEGHSRPHLHIWMLKTVVGSATQDSYLEVFGASSFLYEQPKDFEVLFQVASPPKVSSSDDVRLNPHLPPDWAFDPTSPMKKDARSRFALVKVKAVRDRYSAMAYARVRLSRHLWSIKFHLVEFDRTFSNHSAVREIGHSYITEVPKLRELNLHGLWNNDRLDLIDLRTANNQTFQALDRILYWIEQIRRVEPVAALISEWTATEFLFSDQGIKPHETVEKFVVAYLCPNYPRYVLLDFWESIWQVRLVPLDNLKTRLDYRPGENSFTKPKCSLAKLLAVSLEDPATNPIAELIREYPILKAKWHRVRRLAPGSTTLAEDVKNFGDRLKFDLRTCYRARNTVVHDAATTVSESLRMLQRLNWMLCSCVDQVIFTYSLNPTLSMTDLHRCADANWQKWLQSIQDQTKLCPLANIVDPPSYFTI
jgi:hypothetical protein